MGRKLLLGIATFALLFGVAGRSLHAHAQSGGFALQVTPSPIVETIEPGTTKTVELKIRNQNTQSETLKMGLRAFTINSSTGEVELKNDEPQDVVGWVSFANPVFTVSAGEWYTQKITFAVPANAGFTYSFAITISRNAPTKEQGGKTSIEGSVAVFALLSTNRPDALRKLEIASFSSKKKVYDYLPASFTLQLKNSGNTIIQPGGNIYIQRTSNSAAPLATMPVNEKSAYILPNVTRSMQAEWSAGFPVYKTVDAQTGKKKLTWDWSTLQNFRIGHYVAKAVVIYNDGNRDVPTQAEIDFWVIPWKIISIAVVALGLVTVGIVTIVRKTMRVARKKHVDAPKA